MIRGSSLWGRASMAISRVQPSSAGATVKVVSQIAPLLSVTMRARSFGTISVTSSSVSISRLPARRVSRKRVPTPDRCSLRNSMRTTSSFVSGSFSMSVTALKTTSGGAEMWRETVIRVIRGAYDEGSGACPVRARRYDAVSRCAAARQTTWEEISVTIEMYDLVGVDDRRFSPFCWRTRMALAHKGLDCDARPVGFTEIPAILDGSQERVPVIVDSDRVVADSWVIAEYLEQAYPDRPSLFAGDAAQALARFVGHFSSLVMGDILRIVLLDIHDAARPEDRSYFRADREKRFGRSLEEVVEGGRERIPALRDRLEPARRTLQERPFLGGSEPHYADYILFGALQWPRVVSPVRLLEADDPVALWFERCLDLHDGLGRAMPAMPGADRALQTGGSP